MAYADPFTQLRAELDAMQEQDRGLVVVRAHELRTLLEHYDRTRARDDRGPTDGGVTSPPGASNPNADVNQI